MAKVCFRAKFCRAAVVKEGVKKKPGSQKVVGWPLSYQEVNMERRSMRSFV